MVRSYIEYIEYSLLAIKVQARCFNTSRKFGSSRTLKPYVPVKRVGFRGQGEAFPFSMPFSAAAAACGARRARAGQRGALGCLLGAESSTAGSENSMSIEGKSSSQALSGPLPLSSGESSPQNRALASRNFVHDA